jgi:hypothetical protein
MRGGAGNDKLVSVGDEPDLSNPLQAYFISLLAEKRKGSFAPTKPVGIGWRFGSFMVKCPSALVKAILNTLNSIGCLICQGRGHSKAQCPTFMLTKLIGKGNSLM